MSIHQLHPTTATLSVIAVLIGVAGELKRYAGGVL